jgi:chemotaxis protein methyltransferase CheR
VSTIAVIATDDYVEFCDGLKELCGLDLHQYKRPQMERRLRTYFSRHGIARLTDGLAKVRTDPAELGALLDRITINVSQLWRNPEQWKLLEQKVLPELAANGNLRAWSAGCSYGAEAYTLAAVADKACRGARISITGTDIDRRMVDRARTATFDEGDARTAPREELERAFDKVGDKWVAKRHLQLLTRFETGDLLKASPRAGTYDLILCRNTVIYFSEPIRDALHVRLAHALRRGGILVIGSTERVSNATGLGLSLAHPFIYRKA